MSGISRIIDNYKDLPKQKKLVAIFGVLLLIGGVIYVSAYVIGKIFLSFSNLTGVESDMDPVMYAFTQQTKMTLIMAGILTFLVVFIVLRSSFINTPKHYDKERKIWIMDSDTMGGQRYLTKPELKYEFKVGEIAKVDAPILGQISEKGKEVIGWKKRVDGPSGNQNVLCIAPMGTGKSFGPVRVNLLQAIRRGESFVVTDPKMEIYNSLAQYCEDQGMNVHVLNLAEP